MPVTHGSGILAQEMNVAILSDPASEAPQLPDPGAPRGRRRMPSASGAMCASTGSTARRWRCCSSGAFLLRVWGIKQGLPYSYNSDEQAHFVPGRSPSSGTTSTRITFSIPPAYSYLLHIVFELWFGSGDAVARTYTTDPSTVFVVARLVAAVLGTVAVRLHLSGRGPAV